MKPHPLTLFVLCLGLCAATSARAQTPLAALPAAPATASSAEEQVLADLARQLTERLQLRGELRLEFVRPCTVAVSAGPVETVLLNCPSKLAPSLLLNVRFQSAGRSLGEQTLSLRAQLLRDAWVARTPLERGTAFDPAELDQRRIDILQQREALPVDAVETELTYAVSVPAGRLLTWRDVTRRALVRKGQVVEVSAIEGMLTITTKALALESGAAGDTIKLRNLESKKDFTALVVAAARAQVRF